MELSITNGQLLLKHGRKKLEFGEYKQSDRSESKGKKMPADKFLNKLSDVLFVELNAFWKTMPAASQDKLFEIYQFAVEDIDDARTPAERQKFLNDSIVEIVDSYHDYDAIVDFMKGCKIVPSDKVKDTFDSSLDMLSRRTTYIYEDYFELACMTIVIRAVMPLWNKAKSTYNTPNAKAKNVYYEIDMLHTLVHTHLIHTPPYKRLQEFVDAMWEKATTGKDKAKSKNAILSSAVAGIGTSDIPYYLYATSVVNKLANREINTFRDSGDLITHVYQRLKSEIGKLHNKFANIKPKVEKRTGGDDEDKTGYLESFRTREKVRRDVHLCVEYYLLDYRRAKKHLDDTIPVSLVKACIDSFSKYPPVPIRSDQLVAVQWVLSKIILVRSVPHINRRAMINAMALTQAALIHWRFRSLAKLMSSVPMTYGDDSPLINTPFDTPTTDLREELSRVYPYYRHIRGTTSRKALCPGYQAIEEYSKMFAGHEWELTCTPELEDELRADVGKFMPPRALKTDLADLLIKLNRQRKQ